MALSATAIIDVRNGGSDTANGGLFYTGPTFSGTFTATVANTSAPVVTHSTYSFVAGDVGAYLFISAGTNWLPGWYQIASVAGGLATLNAAIGAAILFVKGIPSGFNTVAGCALVASPTAGTGSVDYSQQNAAQFAPTTYTSPSSSAGTVMNWSGATVMMIGNGLVIPSGVTNATAGYYQITAAVAGVSLTLDRNWNTAAVSTGGNAIGIGGGLASPGSAGAIATVSGMVVFVGLATYVATSASTNISAGCVLASNGVWWQGYKTSRFVGAIDANRPTFQIGSAVSTAILFAGTNNTPTLWGFILDGNSQTASKGIFHSGRNYYMKLIGFTATAAAPNAQNGSEFSCSEVMGCAFATGVTGGVGGTTGFAMVSFCDLHDNSFVTGSTGAINATGMMTSCAEVKNCNIWNITTAGDGINSCLNVDNCNVYACANIGINAKNTITRCVNCVSDSNLNAGYGINAANGPMILINCADYNNSSGRRSGTVIVDVGGITLSGHPFTNAASGDFSLNNTAGAGASLRAAALPATFPAGLTADYADVGAAQHQDSGGGSGGANLLGNGTLVIS